MKYRKKPIVIEAHQWNGLWKEVQGWLDDVKELDSGQTRIELIGANLESSGRLVVHTLEGTMTANIADYIICGTKGEFYFCKPDIFENIHEKVEE